MRTKFKISYKVEWKKPAGMPKRSYIIAGGETIVHAIDYVISVLTDDKAIERFWIDSAVQLKN